MQRSLSVGLLGAPSVGKSTLLNALCRSKVSITSSKAQTTRREVLAVLTDQRTNTQLSFFDTPGVLSPEDGAGNARRRQPRELATAALDVAGRVDALLLVLDASRPLERQPNALYALETLGARRLLPDVGMRALVVNKLDLARDAAAGAARAAILEADLAARGWEFGATFPTIALGGGFSLDERGGQGPAQDRSGVGTLRRWLLSAAVEGEWEHPPHFTGDCAEDPRLWARELTRERLFRYLNKEVPYALEVREEGWGFSDSDGGAEFVVEHEIRIPKGRASLARIVRGKGGALLRKIEAEVGEQLTQRLMRDVRVRLRVSSG